LLCSMSTTLEAQYTGDEFHWVTQNGLQFSSTTSPVVTVTATTPGLHHIQAVAQTQGCTVSEQVDVTFANPPLADIVEENITCYGDCNGSILVNNAAGTSITIMLDGIPGNAV